MRIHRVLVRDLAAGRRTLVGSEAHHLRAVLRVRPGVEVEAFDGAGLEARAQVVAVRPEAVELDVGEPGPGAVESAIVLTLVVALLKGDKLAEVVRKGTELGAARIRLFVSQRADVPSLAPAKLRRLERVAEEAAKQSRRSRVPQIVAPIGLAELPLEGVTLVAWPRADVSLRDALAGSRPASLAVVTGPEGGLTDAEVEELAARGARPVRLGPRILRAETAPIALAAALLLPDAL